MNIKDYYKAIQETQLVVTLSSSRNAKHFFNLLEFMEEYNAQHKNTEALIEHLPLSALRTVNYDTHYKHITPELINELTSVPDINRDNRSVTDARLNMSFPVCVTGALRNAAESVTKPSEDYLSLYIEHMLKGTDKETTIAPIQRFFGSHFVPNLSLVTQEDTLDNKYVHIKRAQKLFLNHIFTGMFLDTSVQTWTPTVICPENFTTLTFNDGGNEETLYEMTFPLGYRNGAFGPYTSYSRNVEVNIDTNRTALSVATIALDLAIKEACPDKTVNLNLSEVLINTFSIDALIPDSKLNRLETLSLPALMRILYGDNIAFSFPNMYIGCYNITTRHLDKLKYSLNKDYSWSEVPTHSKTYTETNYISHILFSKLGQKNEPKQPEFDKQFTEMCLKPHVFVNKHAYALKGLCHSNRFTELLCNDSFKTTTEAKPLITMTKLKRSLKDALNKKIETKNEQFSSKDVQSVLENFEKNLAVSAEILSAQKMKDILEHTSVTLKGETMKYSEYISRCILSVNGIEKSDADLSDPTRTTIYDKELLIDLYRKIRYVYMTQLGFVFELTPELLGMYGVDTIFWVVVYTLNGLFPTGINGRVLSQRDLRYNTKSIQLESAHYDAAAAYEKDNSVDTFTAKAGFSSKDKWLVLRRTPDGINVLPTSFGKNSYGLSSTVLDNHLVRECINFSCFVVPEFNLYHKDASASAPEELSRQFPVLMDYNTIHKISLAAPVTVIPTDKKSKFIPEIGKYIAGENEEESILHNYDSMLSKVDNGVSDKSTIYETAQIVADMAIGNYLSKSIYEKLSKPRGADWYILNPDPDHNLDLYADAFAFTVRLYELVSKEPMDIVKDELKKAQDWLKEQDPDGVASVSNTHRVLSFANNVVTRTYRDVIKVHQDDEPTTARIRRFVIRRFLAYLRDSRLLSSNDTEARTLIYEDVLEIAKEYKALNQIDKRLTETDIHSLVELGYLVKGAAITATFGKALSNLRDNKKGVGLLISKSKRHSISSSPYLADLLTETGEIEQLLKEGGIGRLVEYEFKLGA